MAMKGDMDAREGRLDLTLTRLVDVPRALVWKAWTTPEHLKKWWAPKPYETIDCEMDLRPGGIFRTVMRSPEGNEFPTKGIFLEIVQNERIVLTDTLEPGYWPATNPFFTAIVTLQDEGGKTRYTARALHKDDADREKHEKMGFHEGWGKCLDQLVAVATGLKAGAR
jgi:uncharacterized protein YndB with AHSA1/START domain